MLADQLDEVAMLWNRGFTGNNNISIVVRSDLGPMIIEMWSKVVSEAIFPTNQGYVFIQKWS